MNDERSNKNDCIDIPDPIEIMNFIARLDHMINTTCKVDFLVKQPTS